MLTSLAPSGMGQHRIRTIVIDAGHGGKDTGCLGKKVKEKDVALAVALKLGKLISEQMPDVKVMYTRKTDKFVELHKRAALANKNKADLFISIHCNSSPRESASGSETYVMGLHTSEANLLTAIRENAVVRLEKNYSSVYQGFDPDSPSAHIIFANYQNANLNNSILLANSIEKQQKQKNKRPSRSVKQAGFLVLWKTTCPGVLTEIGFLSNKQDEKMLSDSYGRTLMASAIFRAVREYKKSIEKK